MKINSLTQTVRGFEFDCNTVAGKHYAWAASPGVYGPWIARRPSRQSLGYPMVFLDAEPIMPRRDYRVIESDEPQTPFIEERLGAVSASTSGRPFVRDGAITMLAYSGALKVWFGSQSTVLPTPLIPYNGLIRLVLHGQRLWIWFTDGLGPFKISEVELSPYGQLPTMITLRQEYVFGTSADWWGDLLVTDDDRHLVAAYSGHNNQTFVRVWESPSSFEELAFPGNMGVSSFLVGGIHPADTSFWFFGVKDGVHEMRVIKTHLENGHLVKDFDKWDLKQQEGEMSVPRVIADPVGKELIVSRTIMPSIYYEMTPIRKGSQIGLVFHDVNGGRREFVWPPGGDMHGLCETVSSHGIALDGDTFWLGSHQYNEATKRFDDFTARRINPTDEGWEAPILLVKTDPAIGYRGGAWDQVLACESRQPGPAAWFDRVNGGDARIWWQTTRAALAERQKLHFDKMVEAGAKLLPKQL
jgi:hypothetical protein